MRPVIPLYVIVYAVVDDALSPDFPLGDSLEVFICREDAERFIEDVRSDEPELASHPRRYLRLRWEDVDFDVAVVRVRRSLLEDGTPTKPKTAAGVRAVPMLRRDEATVISDVLARAASAKVGS